MSVPILPAKKQTQSTYSTSSLEPMWSNIYAGRCCYLALTWRTGASENEKLMSSFHCQRVHGIIAEDLRAPEWWTIHGLGWNRSGSESMHHPRKTLGCNIKVQFQLMQKIGCLLQQISSSDPVPCLQFFSVYPFCVPKLTSFTNTFLRNIKKMSSSPLKSSPSYRI